MDPEAGSVSARLEPEHLNDARGLWPPPPSVGEWSRCGLAAGGATVVALLLCLTTTAALVAVQQLQLQGIESKVDSLGKRLGEVPPLVIGVQGDMLGVQNLLSGGLTHLLMEAEMQGARTEQLVDAVMMLVQVLQGMLSGGEPRA